MQELKQSTHCLLRVLFMSQNAEENGAQAEAVKTEHQRYAVHCNGYFHSHGFCFFLSTTSGRMPSIPFNAPSNSSSMSFTYPPTSKISKQSTAIDYCKPSRQNQKKRSPLFNKRSSSPSLCLGHRRRHSPSLHSRVSCFPWSFINLCFFGFNRLCVVFVFNFCVWFSVVFSMTLVWVYWSFI